MAISLLSLPLRYFLEVARTGSVNQAAQRLHVAASAVSRQLGKLEDSLGVVLFERQARGMTLTEAGTRLLAHASAHDAQALELVEQLQDLSAQGALRVRLACTEGFAAAFMPLVMAGFRQAHPQVQLQLQVAVPQEVSALVLRGEADLALKYSTAPEKGLQVLHSAIAPIYAVMPAQHPLARQRSVSVADVVCYPLLLGAANTTGRQLFDLSCAVQGLRYVPAVESNFSSALLPLLSGQDVVLALSGIGKVAAATTTTALIAHCGIERLLFTGVAGGVAPGVRVGDVVVAQQFVQHDMDVRPLFARWLVPGYAQPDFGCDPALTAALEQAARSCVQAAQHWPLPLLGGHRPQLHCGRIASGDQFIVSASTSQRIHAELAQAGYPVLAVEMEGAAIAQVCADYGLPFAAVRTISDRADDSAHVDFPAFVESVASRYALHIVQALVQGLEPAAASAVALSVRQNS